MSDYGKEEKKIVFYDTEKRHAELKIRLHYDGLSQTDFFRGLITGYLEKEEAMATYMEQLKERCSKNGKNRRAASKKVKDLGEQNKNKFFLILDNFLVLPIVYPITKASSFNKRPLPSKICMQSCVKRSTLPAKRPKSSLGFSTN